MSRFFPVMTPHRLGLLPRISNTVGQAMNKNIKAMLLTSVLLFAGCAPKMTYRVSAETKLVLPFSGHAESTSIEGLMINATFEGKYGKIKVTKGNLYFQRGEMWDEYTKISQFRKIELKEGSRLMFDGNVVAPSRSISENEI